MSRFIDANAYIKYCDEHWIPLNVDAVKAQPTADVVEVVRCKDCMHARKRNYAPAKCQWYCSLSTNYHNGNFFCASGEPRMDLLEWIHRGDDDEQGV